MSSPSDVQAEAAIRAHHRTLHDGLQTRVLAAVEAARAGGAYVDTRGSLLVYLEQELLPHAVAEETTLYPAGEVGASELLVRAMREEHRDLVTHVEDLRETGDATAAASSASAILALFESHLAKENDLLLPVLLADPDVSLAALLDGMHELVG